MFEQFLFYFLHGELFLILKKDLYMSWETTLNDRFSKISNFTKQVMKKSTFYMNAENLEIQIDY